MISIVRGNDFRLSIPVMLVESGMSVPFDFTGAEVAVNIKSCYRSASYPYTIDGSTIIASVDGSKIANGTYSVELVIKKEGNMRSYVAKGFRIVESDAERSPVEVGIKTYELETRVLTDYGTRDYEALSNKPQINGVELSGNLSFEELGIEEPDLSGYDTSVEVDKKIKEAGKEFATKDYVDSAKMALFIDMWNAACGQYGKYNAATGFFELNGLTDIGYAEALDIYERTHNLFMLADIRLGWLGGALRTNLPAKILWNGIGARNLSLYGCNIKKICFRSISNFPGLSSQFIDLVLGLKSLNVYYSSTVEIDGVIRFYGDQFITEYYESKIETVKFEQMKKGASFAKWDKLTNESVLYMIKYANNTVPVSFTFHPIVYARAIADEAIAAKALENNTTITSA